LQQFNPKFSKISGVFAQILEPRDFYFVPRHSRKEAVLSFCVELVVNQGEELKTQEL